MSPNIRIEILKRIVFAKMLYKTAESLCANHHDSMGFAKGVLLLHDAVESVLGAIADHLNAKIAGNKYLLDYSDLIKKADQKGRTLPYATQMRNLNTLRNNIKHQGIFPDPDSNAHFPTTVYALIGDICQTYLDLNIDSVSLKSLIKNQTVLNHIEQAEKAIDNNEIEQGLISLAYAMYYICESSTIAFSQFATLNPLRFTQPFTINHTVNLLAHAVDPHLYIRFKALTPQITKTKNYEIIHRWVKEYGHPANWTTDNAKFCLAFCIETALKFQKEKEGYKLIQYGAVYEDIIEPNNDEAVIWDRTHDDDGIRYTKRGLQYIVERKRVLTLKKGQNIIGFADDSEEHLDEWLVISEDIPLQPEDDFGAGYVLKAEVKITRRSVNKNDTDTSKEHHE